MKTALRDGGYDAEEVELLSGTILQSRETPYGNRSRSLKDLLHRRSGLPLFPVDLDRSWQESECLEGRFSFSQIRLTYKSEEGEFLDRQRGLTCFAVQQNITPLHELADLFSDVLHSVPRTFYGCVELVCYSVSPVPRNAAYSLLRLGEL